ncbi:MAG: hypothetical protein J5I53_09040 [Bradyrhizobiaceae bacterium]|nr:hypothetical protein [Bradyrhizobiaceae bacterium]
MAKVMVNVSASAEVEVKIVVQDQDGTILDRDHLSGNPELVSPRLQVEAEMTPSGLEMGDNWHIELPNGKRYDATFSHTNQPHSGDPEFVFTARAD